MNRYEAYLAARAAEVKAPEDQPKSYRERRFDLYRGGYDVEVPIEQKSAAVRYAEEHAEELMGIIHSAFYYTHIRFQPAFSMNELTWNTPFGPVYCRRSRNPEALHGWVFVDG